MTIYNLIIVGVCGSIFAASFMLGDGAALMFNIVGILIVCSGTLGATFLSYPFSEIIAAFRVALNTYREKPPTPENIVNTLLYISIRTRREGVLSIEKVENQITMMFLRDALVMLVDGYKGHEIKDVLSTEMYFFKQRRQNLERIFHHMSRLAPAFGITGSVVGLIGMLVGIGDTNVILKTIPLALTSTLYGIVLSNFLLTPIAESIHFKTETELLMKKLVVDGVCAIERERNPFMLQKKLETFLVPSLRLQNQQSFKEIREKYRQLHMERKAA